MKLIVSNKKNFKKLFNNLIKDRSKRSSKNIDKLVKNIIDQVKKDGDSALIKLSKKYDKLEINKKDLLVSSKTISKYANKVNSKMLEIFKTTPSALLNS